nr:hypothetical protein [Tanacetum cinerariifolium]
SSSSIPQMEYALTIHQQSEFSSPKTRLVVSVFQKGDDPIDAINHMMSFLTAVVTSRVTIQPIQGRQTSITASSSRPYASGFGGASEKQRVVVCYNYKGKGHMSKQCTKPKRKRDAEWFKDKIALMANLSHYGSDNLAELLTAQRNQDNKQVNELLTVELERYKNQKRILKEQNHDDKASVSYEQSLEIENLKHTLSEHLKENESLEQKVTLFKNDFQQEESQNIDRELALEKQVKELNNIVFKRKQSAQTVHMLTKP